MRDALAKSGDAVSKNGDAVGAVGGASGGAPCCCGCVGDGPCPCCCNTSECDLALNLTRTPTGFCLQRVRADVVIRGHAHVVFAFNGHVLFSGPFNISQAITLINLGIHPDDMTDERLCQQVPSFAGFRRYERLAPPSGYHLFDLEIILGTSPFISHRFLGVMNCLVQPPDGLPVGCGPSMVVHMAGVDHTGITRFFGAGWHLHTADYSHYFGAYGFGSGCNATIISEPLIQVLETYPGTTVARHVAGSMRVDAAPVGNEWAGSYMQLDEVSLRWRDGDLRPCPQVGLRNDLEGARAAVARLNSGGGCSGCGGGGTGGIAI